MSWIFEHIQLVLVVAGVIAYWLNQRAREKAGQEADYDEDGVPENRPNARRPDARELSPASRDGSSPEADERVRQIQEEIRRKIAERRGQVAPPPIPMPEREQPVRQSQPPEREPAPAPVREREREVITAYDDTAALERQRRLAEQLEELESRRREARMAAQAVSAGAGSRTEGAFALAKEVSPGAGLRSLTAELRDPKALRRAMVLREVLGGPVALR
jgi:hypothetical protein